MKIDLGTIAALPGRLTALVFKSAGTALGVGAALDAAPVGGEVEIPFPGELADEARIRQGGKVFEPTQIIYQRKK